MSSFISSPLLLCLLSMFIFNFGCDSDDNSRGQGLAETLGSGVVTEEWEGFCTVSFTEDTNVTDTFDDFLFTARIGERYLLKRYQDFGGELKAELYYLTNGAPLDFEIMSDGGFPFESNCEMGQTESYNTVFTNLTVYRDLERTEPLCDLERATYARGISTAYLASGIFSSPIVYKVGLSGFESQCGDVEEGYVETSKIRAFGSENVVAPMGLTSRPAN